MKSHLARVHHSRPGTIWSLLWSFVVNVFACACIPYHYISWCIFIMMYIFMISGWTYDLTSHYPASFYLGGSASILGGLILIPAVRSHNKSEKTINWISWLGIILCFYDSCPIIIRFWITKKLKSMKHEILVLLILFYPAVEKQGKLPGPVGLTPFELVHQTI